MGGYKSDFGGNVDYAFNGSGRGSRDITNKLQSQMSRVSDGGSFGTGMQAGARLARRELKALNDELKNYENQQAAVEKGSQAWHHLQKQIDSTNKSIKEFKRNASQVKFELLEKGIGKVTKGLVSMNASILTMGFDFLISSIKRVYELQERWTKAIGGFNLRLGGMTAGLKGAQRAATAWSGTIRGLTDGDINEGIQMFADFTDAIGRVVQKGDEFEKFGLLMARGFNLGGQGAGQLTKVLSSVGNNSETASDTIKDMIKSANAAQVPVNLLAKDVLDSSVYMARFGKESQKAFVQGAAWARKFTISMEQLKGSVEGLDMFDEAAKTASKLNTAFGTMINSMDLMLTDDPAQRLEMIRQQFLAQGMTFEKLSPKQRRYFSETMHLTEDQTAALLSAANAGQSYADFQEKASKKEKAELSSKQMMEKQLRATAQTMYAFGAAFDRITVAIANAIKPLLVVFGLAKGGGKDFKSFGQVMESITVTVEHFFNSLARNEKWNTFMITLAKDLKKAGGALKDFVMDGRAADLMGDIAGGMKTFYTFVRDLAVTVTPALKPLLSVFLTLSKHLDLIAAAWLSMKGFNLVNGLKEGLSGGGPQGKSGKSYGGTFTGLSKKSSRFSALGKGGSGLGMAAGGVAGGLMGGTGAMIGGMIGGFLGPLGGIVGAALGKGIETLFGSTKIKSKLEKSVEALTKSQTDLKDSSERLSAFQTMQQAKRMTRTAQEEQADKLISSSKNKKIKLDTEEKVVAIARLEQLRKFAKNTDDVDAAMVNLKNDAPLTQTQFGQIRVAQESYRKIVEGLNLEADKLLENEKLKAKAAELEQNRATFEYQKKETEQTLKAMEAAHSVMGMVGDMAGNADVGDGGGSFFRKAAGVAGGQGAADLEGNIARMASSAKSTAAINKAMSDTQVAMNRKETEFNKRDLMIQGEQLDLMKKQSVLMSPLIAEAKALAQKENRAFDLSAVVKANKMELSRETGVGVQDLSRLYKFGTGGIVTRPTMGVIGEEGPEAIIPLSRGAGSRINYAMNQGSGGGGSTNVVTQIADIQLDGQKVGRAIVRTAITGRN